MFALSFTYRLVHRQCLNHKLVSSLIEEENGEVHVQDQDDPTRRDHMLDACHPLGDHGYEKICLKEKLSRSGVWGSKSQVFIKLAQSRKVVQLEEVKTVIFSSSGLCARQRYILIGFLFYRSHVV